MDEVHLHGTTTIDAINTMLSSIGQTPITTLEGPLNSDVGIALNILKETSRKVQARGWSCNVEKDVKLIPDINGHILVPPNILRPLFSSRDTKRISIRQGKLYDLEHRTFEFDNEVTAEIVTLLNFTDLTETLKQYVVAKASTTFQARVVGSPELNQGLQEAEYEAMILAKEEDHAMEHYNLLEGEGTQLGNFDILGR